MVPYMAVITFSDTKELTATDSRSCSNFGTRHSRQSTQMGDHMAADQGPTIEEAWEGGTSIPFTRDYEHHTFFSHKTIKQGKKAIITRPHWGLLGKMTHADVRLADGERVRSVPVDFFSV